MTTYTGVDAKYVIEKLGKGAKVIMCELSGGRVVDCATMTVGAINSFIPRADCKWFVASEEENE